ncbi:MAG TPA: hypothetical protein VL986_07750 [Terracidiphilus sp.]|nr:hypothetical protein [Terracidiphilus sp.]
MDPDSVLSAKLTAPDLMWLGAREKSRERREPASTPKTRRQA